MTNSARYIARHVPVRVAKDFIAEHHRTHRPPPGVIVCLGLYRGDELVGVGCLGRPTGRMTAPGIVELTRTCVVPTARYAASALDARLRRLAQALGFERSKTFTLESEGGASLRAAGATLEGRTRGGEWSRPSRARPAADAPEPKLRWSWSHPVPDLRINPTPPARVLPQSEGEGS